VAGSAHDHAKRTDDRPSAHRRQPRFAIAKVTIGCVIRVLQLLTTTAPGGGPRQVLHLARHLPASEFAVSVSGPWDPRFAADLKAAGIDFTPIAVRSLRVLPVTLERVTRLVRDSGADVVHTHGKGAGFYGRLAARLAGVPSVHTFHGIHYERYSRTGRRLYLRLERWLAGSTHTVINVSRTQDEEALRLGLAKPGGSVVIVNGIDVDELAARPQARKASLGLHDDERVLGCVARFDPIKRHDLLVAAFEQVATKHQKVALLLVGDGPEKARIEQRVDRSRSRVLFADAARGWETNLYTSCDLYVTASAKEGLPLAPLEAMASGRAVVATDVPGHRDVVSEETGLLVPPTAADTTDAAALAEAIGLLLADPARSARMGQAGRERVRREFTLQSMIDRTAMVYRTAAASRRESRRV
jgi:glycosyltransferase involved in cell wall biosynthesis